MLCRCYSILIFGGDFWPQCSFWPPGLELLSRPQPSWHWPFCCGFAPQHRSTASWPWLLGNSPILHLCALGLWPQSHGLASPQGPWPSLGWSHCISLRPCGPWPQPGLIFTVAASGLGFPVPRPSCLSQSAPTCIPLCLHTSPVATIWSPGIKLRTNTSKLFHKLKVFATGLKVPTNPYLHWSQLAWVACLSLAALLFQKLPHEGLDCPLGLRHWAYVLQIPTPSCYTAVLSS